jgi:monovalent cation/proton antiporter MnhG/PhaG subunit
LIIENVAAVVGSAVILSGLAISTIGLYGMLRHPDIFEQLHAGALVTGPGVILILLASLATGSAEMMTSAFLVVVFLLVTSSLSTHVIALAAWTERQTPAPSRVRAGQATATDGATAAPMRVLLAHDGSPGSDIAIALARSISWPDGSTITVIGVTEGDLAPLAAALGDAEATRPRLDPEIAPAGAANGLERSGLSTEYVVRGGDPVTAILNEAEVVAADLVVLGSRDLGRLESMVAGSVALGVLDGAACPVLVARAPRVDKILLATDGSEASAVAAEAVARWPIFEGVDVDVLSVATLATRSENRNTAAAAAATVRQAGRSVVPHVRVGDEATEIVSFAEAHSIDLIVLGSRGRTGLTRALLGSVTRDVVTSTQASVLVVRYDG